MNRQISTLIEDQLPGFITSEYDNFAKVIKSYYEHLESSGQPLDIIGNITSYRDIDYYHSEILKEYTILSESVSSNETTIVISDASSFPQKNGYIKIDDEICFYKERTATEFLNVTRGVSAATVLGDLYYETEYSSSIASTHLSGATVYNLSNLFLYAIVKSFESQYLQSFPEAYLKNGVDKRSLIKNISSFYKTKGTDKSIRFIFNSLVSKTPEEIPSTYNPKDFTLKSSSSEWISDFVLQVRIISGDATNLIGEKIIQEKNQYDSDILYASAIVENVVYQGDIDNEQIYNLVLAKESINGNFEIPAKTVLTSELSVSDSKINVFSTLGWPDYGIVVIGNEVVKFSKRSVNQFTIDGSRNNPVSVYGAGEKVYNYSSVYSNTANGQVRISIYGVLYNLHKTGSSPYALPGDKIQINGPGFETRDPVIFDSTTSNIRWKLNEDVIFPSVAGNQSLSDQIKEIIADVAAIYEDDQYYYVCSSGYPSTAIFGPGVSATLDDKNILKIIRKVPTTTTEIYKTPTSDVGILVDGTLAYSYKDEDYVSSGKIVSTTLLNKGSGYKRPPYVLVNGQSNKAYTNLSGEVVDSVVITTEENFTTTPVIEVISGRNAKVKAIVTNGTVTSLQIVDAGEYYSSEPFIRITDKMGKGRFAEYRAVISTEGRLVDFVKIDEGKFYTKDNIQVEVIEDAVNNKALATATIYKWYKNRYYSNTANLDTNNGVAINSGYGVLANPKRLRLRINDNINSVFQQTASLNHSPILGYAYDGNPIYGPYAYSNPFDATSSIVRVQSGYSLNSSRVGGPLISQYPLGSFIDDYRWVPTVELGKSLLDKNNGRYCVTPDYPNGVYAYFVSIDASNTPVFPYILGENFYSLPVESNYTSQINQYQLPKNSKRLKTPKTPKNGFNEVAIIEKVSSGGVSSVCIEDAKDTYGVGSRLIVNDSKTSGSGAAGFVSSVYGKQVTAIESKQVKALYFTTKNPAYFYAGDIITQQNSGATGQLLGNVFDDTVFVLRNVVGNFNKEDLIDSSTTVVNLILEQNSSYTQGSTIQLTDGDDQIFAEGIVIAKTSSQNTVKVRVVSGQFSPSANYILESSSLLDTVGTKIFSSVQISKNIQLNSIRDNIAVVYTSEEHRLTQNDIVNLDITPNNLTTETTYYVRKRRYQEASLIPPYFNSVLSDSGLGRGLLLNSGSAYTIGVYPNVELIFSDSSKSRANIGDAGDSGNARATITVILDSNFFGIVSQVQITNKGEGYKIGDLLTVNDQALQRFGGSNLTKRFLLQVDHAGLAKQNTVIKMPKVFGLAANDILEINSEKVRITSINSSNKTVTVQRGVENTLIVDHPDQSNIVLLNPQYRFQPGQRILGTGTNDPYVVSYDSKTQILKIAYNYQATAPKSILNSSSFLDGSSIPKVVSIAATNDIQSKLEFSTDNVNFLDNPIVDIQKYYNYKFDTSHYSMLGAYLDFSTSQNYNIYTQEKIVAPIEPGNAGSYVKIRIGFGPTITTNTSVAKAVVNYSEYYYFIVTPDVNTQNSFLQVINDPLSGQKTIAYSTQYSFVYFLDSIPRYDGSGDIFYTTSSKFTDGKIHQITIDNFGTDYDVLPSITGVVPAESNECKVECQYDISSQTIISVSILDGGKNYSKPKAIITDADGIGAEFEVVQKNGVVIKIDIINSGKGYTYTPSVKIVESDNKLYFESTDIGIPENIRFLSFGNSFHKDKTLLSRYRSPYVFVLSDTDDTAFAPGEKIIQKNNGVIIASAVVSRNGWSSGSNILRVEKIVGIFKENLLISGLARSNSAIIKKILYTEYSPEIRTTVKSLGRFASDYGKISSNTQRITDSNFYQDYSYVIKSKTPINQWRNAVRETTHPAGFKLFGELSIDSSGIVQMPQLIRPSQTVTSYVLVPPVSMSSFSTKTTITESIVSVRSVEVKRGEGSISVDAFDATIIRARQIRLSPAFNGSFDESTGELIGRKNFTIIDSVSGSPYTPYNNQELLITLGGVVQEPGNSYKVSSNQITFDRPPLGRRLIEGQFAEAQSFYGRAFKFKSNADNSQYLRKLQNISPQFNNKQKEFDIYYEDGSVVKTSANENLMIFLNAVRQTNYRIKRYKTQSKTDRIVFSSAPINHSDIYNNVPTDLNGEEKFFGFNVGSYEECTINTKLSPFVSNNTYLITRKSDNKVRGVDDTLFAYVFVNGVLQKEGVSYKIVGPNITFTKPILYAEQPTGGYVYSSVDILIFYGKDSAKTLTFYDFEKDSYFNSVSVNISSTAAYQELTSWYGISSSTTSYIYQIINGSKFVWGKIIAIQYINSNLWSIKLICNNIIHDENVPLRASRYPSLDGADDIILSDVEYEIVYKTSASGERILNRVESNASGLVDYENVADNYNYSGYITKQFASILPGDLIKIDGEFDYREVFSVPLFAKTKQYNNGKQVSSSFYAKVGTSSYNGDTLGEGFSVTASILNGVVSDLSWNKRDLLLYYTTNLLLNQTAYNYYTPPVINFIPVDGNGGGAKAEVLVHNGQIIDIVLIDGGYGYTKPPKTIISRGYDVIRNNNKFEIVTTLGINPQTEAGYTGLVSIVTDYPSLLLLEPQISSIPLGGFDISTPETTVRIESNSQQVTLISYQTSLTISILTKDQEVAMVSAFCTAGTSYQLDSGYKGIDTFTKDTTKYVLSGVIDYEESPVYNERLFSLGKLGTRVSSFFDYLFMSVGYSNVSQVTIEQFPFYYPIVDIADCSINSVIDNSSVTSHGVTLNFGIPSIQDVASYLDSPITDVSTVLYVPSTNSFPSEGLLLVGKEIVRYTAKLPDRFTGCIRGQNGTLAESHNAGQYLRTAL